jgi:hypothetical protein
VSAGEDNAANIEGQNLDGPEPSTGRAPKNGSSAEPSADGSGSVSPVRKGGPRTAQGKEQSKYNALKHGIFSKVVLLKSESRAEFDSLLNGLLNDLRPKGAIEEILVDKLVSLLWRYRRILIAEGVEIRRGTMLYSWYKSERDEEEAAIFLRSENEIKAGLFSKIENPFIVERFLTMLHRLKASIDLNGFDSSVDSYLLTLLFGEAEMKAQTLPLVATYKLCSRDGEYPDLGVVNEPEAKAMKEKLATAEGRKAVYLRELQHVIDNVGAYSETASRVKAPIEKLELICRKEPDGSEVDRLLRYEATLERYFDRTLSQLERLQRMRLGQPVLPKLDVHHSHS